ncbi:MAG: alpha/beta fold hydrolase [Acutalibacteraceae bacterium]
MDIRESNWNGYRRLDFAVGGRESLLICPKTPDTAGRWVWRAEFFGAFDTADQALLARGWAIAYHRVSNMYGCSQSVVYMREFREVLCDVFGMTGRAALFGFSRGGLYAFRYAVTWPEDVLALYLDAPVLDIRSWPGGKGAGIGDPACWEECKRWYCLDEHSAWFFRDNPLDRIDELVRTGIPVLLVAGEADDVVPYAENGAVMAARMAAAGGRIHVILKPGVGHHPHSLEDPAPITAFMEAL